MRRGARLLATAVVTGLAAAYVLWKIDPAETGRVIAGADPAYLLAALAIMAVTVLPMAWRWQLLLAAKQVPDRLGWLTRAYFVSYAAGQVLPTSIGGDALRIYETTRRHPGRAGTVAGSVVLERAIGGTATLLLAAVGFALALGRYDVGAYLWVEAAFVAATVVLGVFLFSRRVAAAVGPRAPRLLRVVYEGIHAYRAEARLLVLATALTIGIQAVRIVAIWATARSVGIDLSPLPYYVLGPLLFLVMLVPFTLNGIAVREAFFVSFLGALGVAAEPAFAAGFLFFLVTVALAVPGGAVLLWENLRAPWTASRQSSSR